MSEYRGKGLFSTSLEKTQSPVSGFCYVRNRVCNAIHHQWRLALFRATVATVAPVAPVTVLHQFSRRCALLYISTSVRPQISIRWSLNRVLGLFLPLLPDTILNRRVPSRHSCLRMCPMKDSWRKWTESSSRFSQLNFLRTDSLVSFFVQLIRRTRR